MKDDTRANSPQFALHPLTEEEVEAFLTSHVKYLHNPLTPSEKGLIRDIINVCRPMVNHKPKFFPWREEA